MFSFRFNNLSLFLRMGVRGLALVPAVIRLDPWPAAGTILLVLAAGIGEGLGLTFFLPLLTSTGLQSDDGFSQTIFGAIRSLGIEPTTGIILLLMTVIFVGKGGLQLWANLAIGYAGTAFNTRLRLELVRSLLRARWAIFTGQPMGALANSISTDAAQAGIVVTCAFQIAAFSIQLVVYFAISFFVSWQGTLAALASGLLLFFIMHYFVSVSRRAGKQQQKLFERLLSRLVDQFGMVKPIKAMSAETQLLRYLETDILQLEATQRRLVHSKASLTTLNEPIIIGLLCLGAWIALTTLGMAMADLLILGMVFYRSAGRLSSLQASYQGLVTSQGFLHALIQLLRQTSEAEEVNTGTHKPSLTSGIRLRDVTFDYGAKPVLHHTSIEIEAGRITALIGPSGSGKTSILDLILGLHRPQQGEVLIDGIDLHQIDLQVWRSHIGYVPQETVLLNDSILANVTLGDPRISQHDVVDALRAADALAFVEAMPQGLNSGAGERGMQLSGGQRQRISLARALVRKPLLLVLDEPTSALDAISAAAFCNTLQRLAGSLTVIIVSHQGDVTQVSDTIYAITEGRAERRSGQRELTVTNGLTSV